MKVNSTAPDHLQWLPGLIGGKSECFLIAGPNILIHILGSLVMHAKMQFVVEQPQLKSAQRGADEYQDKYQDSSAQG